MEENEHTTIGSPANSEVNSQPVTLPPTVTNMTAISSTHQNMEKSSLSVIRPNGSFDLLKRGKRGRPRKYDSEGNLSISYKKSLQSKSESRSLAVTLSKPPGFVLASPCYDSSDKKGRERSSSGSGNWQILASLGELFANTAGGDFIPHVLTVNTGEDVASKILSFPQKAPRGICILSANGTVSNVTIRQPGSSGGILTYEGCFEILSLTGSYKIADNGGVKSRTGGLSVSLAGPDGRVIGGGIAGLLTASCPIQVVVGSFMLNGHNTHKSKQNHDSPTASHIPSASDTTTTEKTILPQETPEGETDKTPTYLFKEDVFNGNKQMLNFSSSNNAAAWNGSSLKPPYHRPSPDINLSMSAPGE